jgi:hypothetical protein
MRINQAGHQHTPVAVNDFLTWELLMDLLAFPDGNNLLPFNHYSAVVDNLTP